MELSRRFRWKAEETALMHNKNEMAAFAAIDLERPPLISSNRVAGSAFMLCGEQTSDILAPSSPSENLRKQTSNWKEIYDGLAKQKGP
jgi:hypothetical protein